MILLHHSCKSDDNIDSTGFVVVSVSGFIPVFHWIYLNEYNSNVSYFIFSLTLVSSFFERKFLNDLHLDISITLEQVINYGMYFSLFAFYWWYKLNTAFVKHYQIRTCNEELNS